MSELNTIIEFVKDPNWFPSFENVQTGDFLGVTLFILTYILILGAISFCLRIKSINYAHEKTNSSNPQKRNTKLHIALSATLALLIIAFALIIFSNNTKAIASDSQISATSKVYGYVNPDESSVKIDTASLTNSSYNNAKVSSVQINYTDENMDYPQAIWNINIGTSIIYKGSAPAKANCQTVIDEQKNVVISVTGFSTEELLSLIDKQVLKITYTIEACNDPEIEAIDMMPQQINYLDDIVNIEGGFNLSYSANIDQSTINHANDIIGNSSNTSLNLMLGTYDTENEAKNFILNKAQYNESVYTKYDAYQILMLHDGCAIVGKDTNAVFMALTTFGDMLNSFISSDIRSFIMNDWAVAKYRGFIEGYYGIPWSPENRLDLQDFGGKFKMNTYIFAPKDDEYHSSKWYEPYPESKLAEMKKYVDKGIETKVSFSWAIHPFMGEGQFDWDNYEADKAKIIAKYEQLYNIGVRKFGLSADDMDKTAIIEDQVRLLKDLEAWAKSKGDITSLIFVPKIYNEGFIYSDFEKDYLRGMRQLDDFFDIMWTGCAVMGPCETSTFKTFKEYTNHDAFMWMNFPVNDYCDKCLLMGKGQIMQDNVTNYLGLVSNPMQQAQASKVALYETAYYTWRNYANDTERVKAWKDSFKYVDAGGADALAEMCKHLSYWNGEWLNLDESEDLAPLLDFCTAKLQAGESIDSTTINDLIKEYGIIRSAISAFNSKHTNNALFDEMQPWLLAFDEQCLSSIHALNAINLLNLGKTDEAKNLYNQSKAKFEASQKHPIPSLEEDNFAEPGNKRLFPFAQVMQDYLKQKFPELGR